MISDLNRELSKQFLFILELKNWSGESIKWNLFQSTDEIGFLFLGPNESQRLYRLENEGFR